ncbi:2-dehydropantoate 2-reductase [Sphingobium sp. CECT 9361]|uniref:ketopantoate reductase family protein n=1 Tax=Sphingobium sp. CECT 9361 TaxID=2845384 RepID=UPI001E4E11CA|nr:2-dehydropantoate 2-reductase [Sphingobium sp. CECT 9361]CAH0354238.1 hypothetical protein SPH9361_02924 [Sphingobium sp. CECT 9361]
MKYLIIGAGAMGCVLAGHMTRSGKDVTIIARGDNLNAIQDVGLKMYTPDLGDIVVPIKAVAEDEYNETPDVVIIAVKAYALDTIIPLLDRVCSPKTVVLPLLNALRIGDTIAAKMSKEAQILEGVAYVACERLGPGHVRQKLDFFDIVAGVRHGHDPIPELEQIKTDLVESSADAKIVPNMLQAALRKFVRVSAVSAVLVYYGGTVGDIVTHPERMGYLKALSQEIIDIANAAGCPFPPDDDVMAWAIHSVENVFPEYRTSIKTDFDAGRPIESQTQFADVYELGRELGLAMPAYARITEKCGHTIAV